MKKVLFFLLIMMVITPLRAELMTEILRGDYKATTLRKSVRDSVLQNGGVSSSSSFYKRGVWGTALTARKVSPNGKYEAYIKGNNLYVYKRDFKTDLAVTHDEDSLILNGSADWLYNEEFDCGAMFEWSPDSKFIAFIRLDTRGVQSYEWQEMLNGDSESGRYPVLQTIQYPRVGTPNSKASVCIYDMQYKDIRTLDIGEAEYVPRLTWKADLESGKLYVEKLNRDQNKLEVLEINPKSGVSKLWYQEQCADGWVDYRVFDEWQWLTNGNVIVVSECSGWRQVYLYAANGRKISQLTKDGKDVTKCYGYDEASKTLYYQVANTPMTRQNVSLRIEEGGKRKEETRLDDGKGWCELYFNVNYTAYIEDYQTEATPNRYTLYEKKSGKWRQATSDRLQAINKANEAVLEKWKVESESGKKEFFSFVTERGDTLNGWYIRPPYGLKDRFAEGPATPEGLQTASAERQYPVVMLQYSGPGSQRVVEKWNKKWEYGLAELGYVVVCVDVRGTGARGQKWLHETYMNLGVKEAEDLVSAAHWLLNGAPEGLLWNVDGGLKIDSERMAIGGWSYGGFEALMTMSQENSPFKCGFAIAPVTDFRLYDSGYTERFMRRSQVNERGYEGCALPLKAEQLKGRLLIVHGLADDNVHCQNTWAYIDALVQAGKQFDMQVYPDDNHYLRKRANYEHLHRKLVEFLNDELMQ